MVEINDKKFISAMVLALVSSLFSGAFFIVALKGIEISNGLEFFTLVSVLEFVIMIGYMLVRKRKMAFPRKRYILNSALFATATILLLSIMNKGNIIILSEILTTNILIFIALQIVKHRDIVNKNVVAKLIIGGVVAVIALLFAYGFNKTTLNPVVIIISFLVMVLYGFSNYLFSHNSKHSYTKINFIFWLLLFQLLISSTITVVFNRSVQLSAPLIIYGLIGATFLFLSTIIMIYSYHNIKDYVTISRLVGTSVLFVLSETDVVFISLFYELFIGSLSIYAIISVMLIVLAVYIISSVERKVEVD